jgi:hypothetical protein
MRGVDWQIIVASLGFTLAIFFTWILITLVREEWKIKKLNESVQKLLDGDED